MVRGHTAAFVTYLELLLRSVAWLLLTFNSNKLPPLLHSMYFWPGLMKPYLQYYIQFWGPHNKTDGSRGGAQKMIRGLEHLLYEGRQEVGLFSLKKRQLQVDLTAASQHIKGASKKVGET